MSFINVLKISSAIGNSNRDCLLKEEFINFGLTELEVSGQLIEQYFISCQLSKKIDSLLL